MSESYTSTREGYQKAMQWALEGSAEDAEVFTDTTTVGPSFYHLVNNTRLDYDTYIKRLVEWRGKISDYKPVVHEFVCDGDQLAARMTGTIKVDGADTFFESFMFAKVHKETGKLEHLVERSVWGPVGKEPEHGVTVN